jgi:hypothetical protein
VGSNFEDAVAINDEDLLLYYNNKFNNQKNFIIDSFSIRLITMHDYNNLPGGVSVAFNCQLEVEISSTFGSKYSWEGYMVLPSLRVSASLINK